MKAVRMRVTTDEEKAAKKEAIVEANKKATLVPFSVLEKIPEILECHYTTGNWSILIKVLCRDNEHLMQVLYKEIQQIEGISRTETFISLAQQIDRQITI